MKSLLIVLLLTLSVPVFAQHFTDSTCARYFEFTDKLRKGDTISKADWHNFVQDKAIQVYMADQGLGDAYFEAYRKTMQFVYKPGNEAKVQARVKDSLNNWLVYIIYQYKKYEPGMRAYLKRIEAKPDAYFAVCYKYAYTALPKNAQKKIPQEAFSIIPLHNDAHAEQGRVVFTLLCAYLNDMNRFGALGGHEMHHVLRPQPDINPEKQDINVISATYRVLNEGSADMVDKKYMSDTARALLPSQRYFTEFFNDAKRVLPHMDTLLRDTTGKYKVWDYFKPSEYSNGHVPGTYMSYYIEKNGLKAKLLQHLDDPFYFFIIYNQAAKRDRSKPFVFSDAAMAHLEALERKYFGRGKRR
ncbi:DUF5700 domain-containing putative Zn-dependent protease [Mucilaginibacter ximonensis]|uniref:DUF5700 domain-containing putative Zn-dependent protease n=1 Tax=Mucilaginibacter ximonensis TaxID=538021 RepID=A0ABW5YD45_9SPHI